jgi:hypothetical protein
MIAPSWYPSRRQLRQFAVICVFGFGLIALLVWSQTGSTRAPMILAGVGVAAFLVGLPFPTAIRPLYALLMAIALPIGWVLSNILLMIIFYLAFTPLGLVFRLMGRDPLRIRKPIVDSYWIDHPPRTDAASYYRQA